MLNIIVVGMGPIGLSAARAVSEDKQMKLVGLVDIDPSKLGKTLDDLDTKGKDPGGAVVTSSIAQAAKAATPSRGTRTRTSSRVRSLPPSWRRPRRTNTVVNSTGAGEN